MSSYSEDLSLTTEGGSGIVGIAETYEAWIEQHGDVRKTCILIDLTGLNSGGTAGDIIGDADAANCHLGQINVEEAGSLHAGSITCLEAPTGGEPNIDVHAAVEATGVEDAAASGLTGTGELLASSGDYTLGLKQWFAALPADGEYLYLVAGDATNATYTAGKVLIELYGSV